MALKPVGTQFITKGFSTFTKQLESVNKQYRNLGASINLTGNSISAFGARLSVFSRNGKAYAQWVDAATGSFLKHSEVQERFQNSIDGGNQKIKAINETLTALTASSAKVHPALIAIGAAVGVATVAFKVFKSAVNGVVSVVEAAVSPFIRLGSAIWDIGKKIADFALGDIFAAFGRTLSQVKDGITDTVSEFQTLTIQYESLIARQLRAKNSNLTVAQSLRVAADQAKGLLDWVKQIAVTTPFEVETISRTLAFAQAMGFTVSESKTVTTAIINFTAAMGLGQETMERIIQNFGQMRAAGKVTGTELRDLARGALLPVNDILNRMAENAGIAADQWDDFREAAAKGEVPVDAFFEAFVQLANESFPSAAERMSRTFEGVKNNIVDFFKTVVGLEALGPIFDRITGLMADALDRLLSPAVREAAKIVGESLLQGFNMIWDAIQNKLLPALGNLAKAFGFTGVDGYTFATVIAKISAVLTIGIEKISEFVNMLAARLSGQFDNVTQSAGEWGFNIIASLAEGMAAAAKYVVDVLIQLGNIIADWLQPGSPPKLLPKLDQWGAAAMTEYMKGWTKADFSIFNDIADLVESFVRSISGTILEETDVVPIILEIRDSLAQAMNEIAKSGKASAATIKDIFDALKGGTPELQKYVKLQIDLAEANAYVAKEAEKVAKAEDVVKKRKEELAAANKLVEEAQQRLNDVTARYDLMLDPLKRKLDEISDRGDELDDMRRITQLQLILADVNASALDKERARIEIEKLRSKAVIRGIENEKEAAEAAAQADVDAAQEGVDAAEAAVESAEYALALQEEQLAAAEAYRDAIADELAAQEALIQMQIDTNNLIKEQLDLLESLKEKAKGAGSSFADLFENFGGIGLDDVSRQVSGSLTDFKDTISDIFEKMKENVGEDIDTILGKFDDLVASLSDLQEAWSGAASAFEDNRFRTAWENVSQAGDDVGVSFGGLKDAVDNLKDSFGKLVGVDFEGINLGLGNIILTVIENNMTAMLNTLAGAIDGVTAAIDGIAERIDTFIDAWHEFIDGEGPAAFVLNLQDLETAFEDMVDPVNILEDTILGFWDGVGRATRTTSNEVKSNTKDMKDSMVKSFTDLSEEVQTAGPDSIVPKMTKDLEDTISTGATNMSGSFETFKDETVDKFEKLYDDLVGHSIVPEMMSLIQFEFDQTLADILLGLDGFVASAVAKISQIALDLLEILGLVNDVSGALNSVDKGGYGKGGTSVPVEETSYGMTSTQNTYNNFNLTMPTTASPAGVQRAFGVMSVMVG